MKYDNAGNLQRAHQLGTSSEDIGRGITTGSVGNIYVAAKTVIGLESNTNVGAKGIFVVNPTVPEINND
jgi:hypothetical protein